MSTLVALGAVANVAQAADAGMHAVEFARGPSGSGRGSIPLSAYQVWVQCQLECRMIFEDFDKQLPLILHSHQHLVQFHERYQLYKQRSDVVFQKLDKFKHMKRMQSAFRPLKFWEIFEPLKVKSELEKIRSAIGETTDQLNKNAVDRKLDDAIATVTALEREISVVEKDIRGNKDAANSGMDLQKKLLKAIRSLAHSYLPDESAEAFLLHRGHVMPKVTVPSTYPPNKALARELTAEQDEFVNPFIDPAQEKHRLQNESGNCDEPSVVAH